MRYNHTQKAPLYLLLVVIASSMFVVAWLIPEQVTQAWLAQWKRYRSTGSSRTFRFSPRPIRFQLPAAEAQTLGGSPEKTGWNRPSPSDLIARCRDFRCVHDIAFHVMMANGGGFSGDFHGQVAALDAQEGLPFFL